MMSLQKDVQNVPQQTQTWKRRLQTWQNSLRMSFRPKRRIPKSANYVKISENDNLECATSKNSKSSPTANRSENTKHLWRERKCAQRQANASKFDKEHDRMESKSTVNGNFMNVKTRIDVNDPGRQKSESRKRRSNSNISGAEKTCPHLEKRTNVADENLGQSSANNTHRKRKKNKTTGLRRPTSLSVLTSLFKRSSSSTGTQNINTNRGNKTKCQSQLQQSENGLSTRCATEDKFVLKCDPDMNFSSCDSFTDADLSPRLASKYYSLKRSRASLIYPRNSPSCDRATRREKARTFCCEQDFLLLENSAENTYSSEFDMEWNGDKWNGDKVDPVFASSRSVCFLTRGRRAFSDILPSSVSALGLSGGCEVLQLTSSMGERDTHFTNNKSTNSNLYSPSRESSYGNIPKLGVTLVDNDGNEKTIDALSNVAPVNDTDTSDLVAFNERDSYVKPMGNISTSCLSRKIRRCLEKKDSPNLKHAKSSPEIHESGRSAGKPSEVILPVQEMKSKVSFLMRNSSPPHKENCDGSSADGRGLSSKLTSSNQSANDEDFVERSMTLALKHRSLNRSVDCLTILSDSTTNKLRKMDEEWNEEGDEREVNEFLDSGGSSEASDFEECRVSEVNNNFHEISSPNGVKSIYSRTAFEDEAHSKSAPSSLDRERKCPIQNSSVIENDSFGISSAPKHSSTPEEARPSLHERRRQANKEASSKFCNINARSHTKEKDPTPTAKPPYVRPRIQSLEELSPIALDGIMRKKDSLLKKSRFRHSISVPNEGNLGESLEVIGSKRYSYHGDFIEDESSFLSGRSQSTEILASHESLVSNSSLSVSDFGSATSIGSDNYLTPPPMHEIGASFLFGRSKSIAIPMMENSPQFGSPVSTGRPVSGRSAKSPEEVMRKSLRRNLRLGKSTGDLKFEPSGILKSKESLEDDDFIEDMDMPEAFAEALWDHVTMDPEELSFRAGDVIDVISMTNVDWWFGQVGDQVGWFPAPFVRVRVSQTLEDGDNFLAPPVRSRRGTNEGMLTNDVVRARVVKEILNTERDYVKNLRDVVEGYLRQVQKRREMFTDDQIYLLFSNIEEIYKFHQDLLAQLKGCYVKWDPCSSLIGQVFLENKQGFSIYSEYCNNHPHAIAELKTLCESNNYKHFFEACRLLQDMINISLDGFLLTPVQKICKYPLQLAELLKHTYPTHKDYEPVRQALNTMKEVASLINERKRKVENVYKIAKWQSTIEGWEGENVLEQSSELIHSGDVHKISAGTSQERVFFLFDNQLLYCKKDILRKNGLSYKGRIDLNTAHITWLEDREEYYKSEPLLNAWKIYNETKNKWYVVYTKTKEQKDRWKKAFAEERRIVTQDAISGMAICKATRRAAMRAANVSIKGKKERAAERREKFVRSASEFMKAPPSPTLRLPPPVSSADLIKEEDENSKTDKDSQGFLQRTSVLRRSFGLRGSGRRKNNKEKRMSSVF